MNYQSFEFLETELTGRTLRLRYRLAGDSEPITFEETLVLPENLPAPDPLDPATIKLIDGIHRMFGVSYFKTFAPPSIEASPVSRTEAAFWNTLYTEGMSEFWYTNRIDPTGRIAFPHDDRQDQAVPVHSPGPGKALVLVGGGKDSIVAAEIVKHAGVEAVAFTLGNSRWQAETIDCMQIPHLAVERRLDPQLLSLNEQGALNGHVPISGCYAFIAELVAVLAGCSEVMAANEHSANEANLAWRNFSVNHQWSKSLAFEQAFQDWLASHFTGAPGYFSLLRPLDELQIAHCLSRHDAYFDHFSSCNRNFTQQGAANERWCGRCPKCVFSQLILATCLPPDALERIFGADFLDSDYGLQTLAQLTGISGDKPFDCVGTEQECCAALQLLANGGRLRGNLLSWYRANEDAIHATAGDRNRLAAQLAGNHRLPPAWEQRLHAYLGY